MKYVNRVMRKQRRVIERCRRELTERRNHRRFPCQYILGDIDRWSLWLARAEQRLAEMKAWKRSQRKARRHSRNRVKYHQPTNRR